MTTFKKLSALAVAGTLILAGCGDGSPGDSASSASGNGADRAYAADMVSHHQSAVAMAKIAQTRGKSDFVKTLANSIITSQTAEIATLRAENKGLAEAGVQKGSLGVPQHMTGMDHDPATLTTAAPFDKAFLAMMIPHHQGALVMSRAELKKGRDPQLKSLAQQIISAQEREIATMRKQLGAGSAGHATSSMSHSSN